MTLLSIIQKFTTEAITDKAGNKIIIKLKPGLTQKEITEFEQKLHSPIPDEVKTVLTFTSGIELGPLGFIDFLGQYMFELEDVLPGSLPILDDGEGNFWVIDIRQDTGFWGKIFFVCHDPAVIVIQAQTLAEFLTQILELFHPPYRNAIEQIKEDAINRIVESNPYLIDVKQARTSTDAVLAKFASQVADTTKVVDLRGAEDGAGFSWWESGKEAKVQRYGTELIFGIDYIRQPSFLNRLLGKRN